jgi:hypothetical protein
MKYLGILSLLFLGLVSCNDNSIKNIELVERYIHAVENNDPDLMESLLAENYLGLGPSYGDSINKSSAVKNWKLSMSETYQKIEYKKSRNAIVKIVSGENLGDWVSNWAELQITYKNDSKEVTIWANTIYQIEHDKIIKSYTFYNEADVLRQLDYVYINSKFLE